MTTANDVRNAHHILDELDARAELSQAQEKLLRSFLPELPKQKTLEEITELVNEAWSFTHVNEWDDDAYGSLESWLSDLETQLQGVKETSANVPELPVGMRLAKHENYGRVVVTDWIVSYNKHFCVYRCDVLERGSYVFLPESSLTFIDSEPAKYDHPEFLETEADYQNAPEGTIVACDDSPPCHKFGSEWSSVDFWGMKDDRGMSRAIRRVLRWGK